MSTATASPARARKARILAPPVTGQEIVLIGVIALLWTLLAFNTPAFLTASSIQPLLGNVAPIALIGIGTISLVVTYRDGQHWLDRAFGVVAVERSSVRAAQAGQGYPGPPVPAVTPVAMPAPPSPPVVPPPAFPAAPPPPSPAAPAAPCTSRSPISTESMFSATFCAVAAPIRVEPDTTSAPVSISTGISAISNSGEPATLASPITATCRALAARAMASA